MIRRRMYDRGGSCKYRFKTKSLEFLRSFQADRTGLEPATSAVTGQHSNQLNYRSNISKHSNYRENYRPLLFKGRQRYEF